jgi:hypothetical protein
METFNEFVDKKERDAKKQLKIVKKLLESQGLQVGDHLGASDPYIFLRAPVQLSFDGVRIYRIGNTLAYKVQREEKTHPYGKAYLLDIEEMFTDYMSDNISQEKAGKKVISSVKNEFKQFFEKSAEAESELEQGRFDKKGDPLGRVMIQSTGTDYANKMQGRTFGSTTN